MRTPEKETRRRTAGKADPRTPLTKPRAWACASINQFAFPGLGTLMAGRRIAGYLQATLMVVGSGFLVAFMVWMGICMTRSLQGELLADDLWSEYARYAWVLLTGFGLCAASWCWALLSSIRIVRSSTDPEAPPNLDSPGGE